MTRLQSSANKVYRKARLYVHRSAALLAHAIGSRWGVAGSLQPEVEAKLLRDMLQICRQLFSEGKGQHECTLDAQTATALQRLRHESLCSCCGCLAESRRKTTELESKKAEQAALALQQEIAKRGINLV